MEYPKFKVCCRCFTFNQAKYITDAMNGFTMQQTSFPFVCTIVDDASTDGGQDIIRKYVEENFDFSEGSVAYHKETDYAYITYAQHKTNKNCYFAVLYLKENHYSQRKPKMGYLSEWRDVCDYEALCEGDDYWIDPTKLQNQINVMKSDPSISLCYTRNLSLMHDTLKTHVRSIDCIDFRTFLLYDETITLTAMYPTKLYLQYLSEIDPYKKQWLMGDTPLWLYLAQKGRIYPIDKLTAIYNAHEGSASRSGSFDKQLLFNKSALEIRLFFINRYKECEDLIDTMYSEYYRSNLITSYVYGKFAPLVKNYIKISNKKLGDLLYLVKFWPRKIIK